MKERQAILKHFIDLKFSVSFTLCLENETKFCDTSKFFSAYSFLFPLSSFPFPDSSRKDRSDSASKVECRSFSVLTILAVDLKKVVSQKMVSFSEHSVNQMLNLRSIKCFRIA